MSGYKTNASTPIGVIGVGVMGSAISRHLVDAGFVVHAYDVSREALFRAVANGAKAVGTLDDIVGSVEIALTCLPSPAALDAIVTTIESGRGRLRTLIETSTLALGDKTSMQSRLQALGIAALDCPLSGTGHQALSKDVVIYASGERIAYDACLPILSAFAKSAPYLGAFGSGTRMKMIANHLVAIHTAAAGEACALARKAGLDPAQTLELLIAGAGSSRSLEARADMLVSRSYEPIRTMPLELWRKDLAVIGSFAAELDCPTPLFAAARELFSSAIEAGLGRYDTAAVAEVSAAKAGLSNQT